MSYLGEFPPGTSIIYNFSTAVNGVPTTLASPTVSIYKADDSGETTTGPSITADWDSHVGLNHLVIATTDGFYVTDTHYSAVLTVGTLGGVSQVGYEICSFRLTNERATIDKTIGAVPRGTVTSGASTTSIPTSALAIAGTAASGVVTDQFKGRVVLFDGGTTTAGLRGASSAITASTASNTPTLTVDPALPATPASGDLFSVI